jgi:hypothetical protein
LFCIFANFLIFFYIIKLNLFLKRQLKNSQQKSIFQIVLWTFTILENNISFSFQNNLFFHSFIVETGIKKIPNQTLIIKKFILIIYYYMMKQKMLIKNLLAISLISNV